MRRKFTASVLSVAVLASGVASGAALATPSPSGPAADHTASVDRSSSKHSESIKDRSRHESASREPTAHARQFDAVRDR